MVKKGGGCNSAVDTSGYLSPCGSLPLDNAFQKYKMNGGGYFFNGQMLNGMSVVQGYSECCPPQYETGNGSTNIVSDQKAPFEKFGHLTKNGKPQCGGSLKKKNSKKINNKRKSNSRKSDSRKSNSRRSNSRRSNFRRSNSRKSNYRRSNSKKTKSKRSNKRRQSGGMAPLESLTGANSNFSGDMSSRSFGCRQPSWKPGCV